MKDPDGVTGGKTAASQEAGVALGGAEDEISRVRLPAQAIPSRSLAEMLPEALRSIEAMGAGEITGVPTGFAELDGLTSGLPPGTLTVIASAASVGKSTLVLDFCRSAAIRHKLPAVLFSLEMTAAEITMRLLSAESRIPLHLMRTGQMTDDNRARLTERMAEIADAPFYLSESPALSVNALSDEAARLVGGQGVRLVAVDCLQLITTDRRFENREREVAEIAQQLKALALSLQVPVVIAAQLAHDPEQGADKRPLLADLRDSDAITQAADLVVLLHREDAFERESPRAGEADFIVAKHRNGPTATVTVAFQGHYSRFADHQGLSAQVCFGDEFQDAGRWQVLLADPRSAPRAVPPVRAQACGLTRITGTPAISRIPGRGSAGMPGCQGVAAKCSASSAATWPGACSGSQCEAPSSSVKR